MQDLRKNWLLQRANKWFRVKLLIMYMYNSLIFSQSKVPYTCTCKFRACAVNNLERISTEDLQLAMSMKSQIKLLLTHNPHPLQSALDSNSKLCENNPGSIVVDVTSVTLYASNVRVIATYLTHVHDNGDSPV